MKKLPLILWDHVETQYCKRNPPPKEPENIDDYFGDYLILYNMWAKSIMEYFQVDLINQTCVINSETYTFGGMDDIFK